MIFDIVKEIADFIKSENLYFKNYDYNCIAIGGKIVKPKGYDYTDAGITDEKGIGFYLRYMGGLEYKEVKRISSMANTGITAKMRFVAYNFGSKYIHPFYFEQKLRDAFSKLNEYDFLATENEIKTKITSAILNNFDVYKEELQKDYEGGIENTIIAIDFDLSFMTFKDKCLECEQLFTSLKC